MEKKQKVPLSVKMLENLAIALNLKPQDLLKTGLILDDLKHDLREHKIPVKLLSSQEDLQDQTLLFDENNQDQAQMVLRYLKKVGLEKYLQDLQSYFQALQSRFRANSFKADLSHKPCPTVLDDQDFAKINENLQKLEQILTYKQILALVGKA